MPIQTKLSESQIGPIRRRVGTHCSPPYYDLSCWSVWAFSSYTRCPRDVSSSTSECGPDTLQYLPQCISNATDALFRIEREDITTCTATDTLLQWHICERASWTTQQGVFLFRISPTFSIHLSSYYASSRSTTTRAPSVSRFLGQYTAKHHLLWDNRTQRRRVYDVVYGGTSVCKFHSASALNISKLRPCIFSFSFLQKQEGDPSNLIWMNQNFTTSWNNITSGRLYVTFTFYLQRN